MAEKMYWPRRLTVCSSVLLLVFQSVYAQTTTQQCGTVGHDLQTAQTRLTDLRFYLNTQNPAPCSGNVSTWEYCYYAPELNATEEYQAPFGLYRLVGDDYQLVSQQFLIDIPNNEIGSDSFTCRAFLTPVTAIQQGDVIGTCVHDVFVGQPGQFGGTRTQINLAGSASGYTLLSAGTSNSRCNNILSQVRVPGSVSTSDLSTRSSTILHLYANIEVEVPPTIQQPTSPTTQEPTTQPPTTTESSYSMTMLSATTQPTTDSAPTTTQAAMDTTQDNMIATSVGSVDQTSPTGSTATTTEDVNNTMNTPGIINTSDSPTAAVVGVVVALLLVFSVVVLLVVFLTRKMRKDSYAVQRSGTSNPNALDNMMYETFLEDKKTPNERAQLEASAYEIPVTEGSHDYAEASYSSLTHTYEYTSTEPYEELTTTSVSQSPPVYESPLDAPAVSFSALLKKNQTVDIYASLEPFRPPSTQEDAIYGLIRSCGIINIPRTAIRSIGHLGSGQYGNVEEGTWKKGVNKEVRVALKTLNAGSSAEEKIKFLQEAAIMAQFRHPNVVTLYGVVTKGEPVILVAELVHRGDLRHYLNSIRPDPGELPLADLPQLLLRFSQQIALGMQYLSGKGFVHRDLAARNILVSEDKICKVSDFGMSRDLADETYYVAQGGKIPVKWTAPEALHFKKYSTASDVWSYGCLLYEIWSLGLKPFQGITNVETIHLVESGQRLSPPPGCPRMIYQLMILCWNPSTSPRPSFRDLVLTLVGNQQVVLSIPRDALETHQLAGVLGAPLENGEGMYQDLQSTYVNQDGSTKRQADTDNDYEEFD